MLHDPRKLLFDIESALGAVERFCHGRTLDDYRADEMLRAACERQLEIVGEAMARLRDRHPASFDAIPDAAAIIGFRNRLIHGYDTVDAAIVWDVIQTKLQPLRQIVRGMLE